MLIFRPILKTKVLAARGLCLGLGVFDLGLGGLAAFSPKRYAALLHPEREEPLPRDFIVRTGVLWLFFALAELTAATRIGKKSLGRWFFLVGALRLMDVPADLAYGKLAAGSPPTARAAIWSAPAFNLLAGAFLCRLSRRL